MPLHDDFTQQTSLPDDFDSSPEVVGDTIEEWDDDPLGPGPETALWW